MPARRGGAQTSPRDATGRKREQLAKQHAAEQEARSKELGMMTAAKGQPSEGITDLTRQQVVAGRTPDEQAALDAGRAQDAARLPLGATKQPGMPGVSVDSAGILTDTAQPGFSRKTNSTATTGTGTETPFSVPGATIANQVTRGTVDTVNAGYVGAPGGGPDPEAPRQWLLGNPDRPQDPDGAVDVVGQRVLGTFPEDADVQFAGRVQTLDREPTKVIRTNTTLEDVTIGVGTNYTFIEGQQYRVPQHVADHLEELGYIWH